MRSFASPRQSTRHFRYHSGCASTSIEEGRLPLLFDLPMRFKDRSRFSPTLGILSTLVLLLLFSLAASADDELASTSDSTVESSSIEHTTEFWSSTSVSEEFTSDSTTEVSTIVTTSANKRNKLEGSTGMNELVTCSGENMETGEKDSQQYHTADFSSFEQKDFDEMVNSKNGDGKSYKPKKTRTFLGNFVAIQSKLINISLTLNLDADHPMSFILEKNKELEVVQLIPTSDRQNVTFTVAGNKKLSNESINNLKNFKYKDDVSSYIQDFGECDLDNATLPSASQLKGCHYVRGDLIINENSKMDLLKEDLLTKVTGCIKITNTEVKDLNLTSTITKSSCTGSHEITDNKKLCLLPEDLHKTLEHFQQMGNRQKLVYDNNMPKEECIGKCTSAYLKNHQDKNCTIITDSLTIEKTKEGDDVSYLSQIEEIHGSLHIQSTTLKNVTLFPSLTTIIFDVSDQERAIFVQENKEMEYFDLPKLTTVVLHKSRKNNNTFVMERNGDYTMDADLAERFFNITHTDRDKNNIPIKILHEDLGNFTATNTTNARRRKNDETKVEDDEQEEEALSGRAIAGIVVGILSFVGIIIALIIVFVRCRRLKEKQRNELRQNKMKEEVRVQIQINDITSSTGTVGIGITSELEDKCDTVADANSLSEEDENEMEKATSREPGAAPSPILRNYFNLVEEVQFKKLQRFNYDVTHILGTEGVVKIKIKRDNIDFEAASKLEPETMKPQKINKIYTHNPKFTLYGISPRKEKTKEIRYDHGNGPFIPEVFIQNCMKSSAVTLSHRTIMAALDYVMKNKRFGNPDDAKDPPKQLIDLTGPIHVSGDTHGSLIDIQMLFSLDPENVAKTKNIHPMMYYKYLFTGDYLDRGIYDTTCFAFLTVFATLHPNRVFLLRGNHEWFTEFNDMSCTLHTRWLWSAAEGHEIREKIQEISCWLPIAARINGRAMAVHGGIGHFWEDTFGTSDDLRKRFDTIPLPMCMKKEMPRYKKEECFKDWPDEKINEAVLAVENILWNDPLYVSCPGSNRGLGAIFNDETIDEWNKRFNLDVIIRAHQDIGFYYAFGGKLISLFGSFDGLGSKYGVPYMFSDQKKEIKGEKDYVFADHCEALLSSYTTASLRITSDNTLHFLMMRHLYEGNDSIAAPPNKRKKVAIIDPKKPEGLDEYWKMLFRKETGKELCSTQSDHSGKKSAKGPKKAKNAAKKADKLQLNRTASSSGGSKKAQSKEKTKPNKKAVAAKTPQKNKKATKPEAATQSAQSGMESAEGPKKSDKSQQNGTASSADGSKEAQSKEKANPNKKAVAAKTPKKNKKSTKS